MKQLVTVTIVAALGCSARASQPEQPDRPTLPSEVSIVTTDTGAGPGATNGAGPGGGANGSGGSSGGGQRVDQGCGCTLPGAPHHDRAAIAMALALLGAALTLGRRRPR